MKTIKRIISSIKYAYSFLKVLNSPFKLLKLIWYFGEIRHGTPYFLPRKWVKYTKEDCIEALKKEKEVFAKANREIEWDWKHYKGYQKAIPIKYFHWYFTSLGWKTKWSDYRFEWNPSLSIVIFGKQLFIEIVPNIDKKCMHDVYWEAWLNYEYKTNKKLSKSERLEELVKIYTCTWISYSKDKEPITTDYYPYILKNKYLNKYNEYKI